MRQISKTLSVFTTGRGLTPITEPIVDWVRQTGMASGLLTIWCKHTSASLIVQENADPTVLRDIATFLERLIPEGTAYRHQSEGPDDMPAHLRAMLTCAHLGVPLLNGSLALGTWQGIYLFEHRKVPHQRQIVLHLMGDR